MNGVILFVVILFLVLALLPIGFALYWYYHSKESVLPVRQDRTRDPRYFSNSFRKKFLPAWDERTENKIKLSGAAEEFIFADNLKRENYPEIFDCVTVAENIDFKPAAKAQFRREIYAFKNAEIAEESVLRAIHADGSLKLENGVQLIRWADAEGLVQTGDNCELGMSLSSATRVEVGKNCVFRRLYAPQIKIAPGDGELFGERMPKDWIYEIDIPSDRKHKCRIKEDDADENGVIYGSYVSDRKIIMGENLVLAGSISSGGAVHVGDNSIVCGNIFANGDIDIGRNCVVLGNVFSQGDIYCESGTIIGSQGKIRSMIARDGICFEENCYVHGYVSCEKTGMCCPSKEKQPQEETAENPDRTATENNRPKKHGFNRTGYVFSALAALVLVVVLCFGAEILSVKQQIKAEKEETVYQVDLYRNQGLPEDKALDGSPKTITESTIGFTDRSLKRTQWTDEELSREIKAINSFIANAGENVRSYVMPSSLRIGFEEEFSNDQRYLQLVAAEKARLAEREQLMQNEIQGATFVPVMDALDLHKDEYIFYNFAPEWTARGSYYAAQEFLKAADFEGFPIEEFYESAKLYTQLVSPDGNVKALDRHYVYLYENYNPLVTDISTGEKSPMISGVRNGTTIFMGENTFSELMGLADNGRVLFIVGDYNGAVVVPWMVRDFEKIVYMNTSRYSLSKDDFSAVYNSYPVTDLLIIPSAAKESFNRETAIFETLENIR